MKALRHLSDLPIRNQITLLLVTPCVVVLLLAGVVMMGFQVRLLRHAFARDAEAVAHIVGANCTAAITFNDPKAAAEILESLKEKPHVVSAILLRQDGSTFATYGNHHWETIVSGDHQTLFRESDIFLVEPVILEDKQIATLNVVFDLGAITAGLVKLIAGMVLIITLVGIAVVTLLSRWLQRRISDPIQRLTRTAETVAVDKNYSVRAAAESNGELAVLARTFNQMLVRIQEQDDAITLSQQKLEALVNSIEGIVWECDPVAFRFTFVSQQSERMLGYRPEQWLADPNFWQSHLHPDDAREALRLCHDFTREGKPYAHEYRMLAADGRVVWIRESGTVLHEQSRPLAVRGIFLDITHEKLAEEDLERLNRRLVETSRFAGMAEVATGVLHNVGNVLNSVTVSANLVRDRLKASRVSNLCRATAMLKEREADLLEFLATDPRGKRLPEYLATVSQHIANEQASLIEEVSHLGTNVEHIKEIVARQQSYAKVAGAFEDLHPEELIDDALRINATSFERHHIVIVREIDTHLPRVHVDRHKALQILINLLRNAKEAIDANRGSDRRLLIKVGVADEEHVAVRIRDTGIGIAPDNLTRIFQHGFTTKKSGHGFGLHSGANAAREIGGRLSVHSDGLGQGAEFTLVLPVASEPMAWRRASA
ncbi:MAG: PAS domain-containing protein [Verrucomicrobiales bacterium]|nr:PAS domain-containing protein [Verrucomicrobiales bacterium]